MGPFVPYAGLPRKRPREVGTRTYQSETRKGVRPGPLDSQFCRCRPP